MLIRLITWTILFVVVYRVFAKFVLPIFNITRVTSNRLKDMQRKMEEMEQRNNINQSNSNRRSSHSKDDYIDYEEVK